MAVKCAALACFIAALSWAQNAAAAGTSKSVLLLSSYQRPLPANVVIDDTLRRVVPEAFGGPVEISSEFLDLEHFADSFYAMTTADFLRHKYERQNVGVIVAFGVEALWFTLSYRERMFPGVPVVHINITREELGEIVVPSDVIGWMVDLDPAPTLALALRLHPRATRLIFVSGTSAWDRDWEQRLRKAGAKLARPMQVEFLAGLPTSDVLRQVRALTGEAIVFTPGYFVDAAGRVFTPRQSSGEIASASGAPVYSPYDTFLGNGVVGGYTVTFEDQARRASEAVAVLLKGDLPAAIPSEPMPNVFVADWRQLRRWRIDESALPAGSVVRFREPTAWDKYWREISVGLALLVLQAGLIIALLFERRSRRRTATELEESQEQMNQAARAARLSVWIWDAARDKIAAAARSRHDGPLIEHPLALEDVLEAAHPADREDLKRAVAKAVATGEELDVEYRVMDHDGKVRWVSAHGRAEKGNSQRLRGIALDVTERKAADLRAAEDRSALRHMTRVSMLGQLSAAVSHQLNQPLAAILGNAEAAQKMLGREKLDLAELRAICNDIVSEDHRAAEVIRRLSELYKRGDMKMEPIDLNELVGGTLDLLRTELVLRHVIAVSDFATALPPIEGAHVQLQQVVFNLMLNAADALSEVKQEERRLTIRTENGAADVRLYVIDNGSGISPNHLKTMFDPFWTTKAGGMGMGLAICQSIVAAHRGSITAANNAPGGATFCVSLPAMRQP